MADEVGEIIDRYSTADWRALYTLPEVVYFYLTLYIDDGVVLSVRSQGAQEDVTLGALILFLKEPIENMPLYINDDYLWKRVVSVWRLKVAK
jgi:hypothetical protein